jgi:hypothetical protein
MWQVGYLTYKYDGVQVIIDKINASNQLEFEDLSEVMQNSYTYVQTFGKFRDATSITKCKE